MTLSSGENRWFSFSLPDGRDHGPLFLMAQHVPGSVFAPVATDHFTTMVDPKTNAYVYGCFIKNDSDRIATFRMLALGDDRLVS